MGKGSKQRDFKSTVALALGQSQGDLYGYIFTLLCNRQATEDVLQDTNCEIMKNLDRLDSPDHFLPWAKTVAFYQVKRYRTLAEREKTRLVFDDETVENLGKTLAAEDGKGTEQREATLNALDRCIQKLPPSKRHLIHRYYWDGIPVKDISDETQSSPSAIKITLLRIRRELGNCIRKFLCRFGEEPPPNGEDAFRAELFESAFEKEAFVSSKMDRRIRSDDEFRDDWLNVASVHAALLWRISQPYPADTSVHTGMAPFPRRFLRPLTWAAGTAILLGGFVLVHRASRIPVPQKTPSEAVPQGNPVSVAGNVPAVAPSDTATPAQTVPAALSIPQPDAPTSIQSQTSFSAGRQEPAAGGNVSQQAAFAPQKEEVSMKAASTAKAAVSALAFTAALTVKGAGVSGRSGQHCIDTRNAAIVPSNSHYIEARDGQTRRSAGTRTWVIDTAKPLGTVIMLI